MAYDGKVMRLALQRFEEDRQRRQAQYQERRERIFARQPRLREIDGELRSTMSRIITSALRHGTDPRSAVAVLRDENLSLQAEKRELLQKMGLPEDALEETPACALCGDTGYRNGRVCRCLRGYYAREQQKELSRMLDPRTPGVFSAPLPRALKGTASLRSPAAAAPPGEPAEASSWPPGRAWASSFCWRPPGERQQPRTSSSEKFFAPLRALVAGVVPTTSQPRSWHTASSAPFPAQVHRTAARRASGEPARANSSTSGLSLPP